MRAAETLDIKTRDLARFPRRDRTSAMGKRCALSHIALDRYLVALNLRRDYFGAHVRSFEVCDNGVDALVEFDLSAIIDREDRLISSASSSKSRSM
jgi:hypothetical protein